MTCDELDRRQAVILMSSLRMHPHNSCPAQLLYRLLVLTLLCCFAAGCGKKAPPRPPQQPPPPAAARLTSTLEGAVLTLTWNIAPADTKKTSSDPGGFIVFRAKSNLSNEDCPTCPQTFERVADIAVGAKDLQDLKQERWIHRETLSKGYRYTYKVTVYAKNGVMGKDSNSIEITYDKL